MRVAIIGGGASGVTAALLLQNNFKVTIFEREEALLLKLRRTGNGRANIYNKNMDVSFYNDKAFMQNHINDIIPTVEQLFRALGILTYTDEAGRVYPYSESAKVLRENLLSKLKADIRVNTNVMQLQKKGQRFLVDGKVFDSVLLATGSAAGLMHYTRSNNNSPLFNSANMQLNEAVPTIKTLAIKEDVKRLANIRVKAALTLLKDEEKVHTERGELMFKKDGLSGIVSFILSSYFEWEVRANPRSKYRVSINLMPEYTREEIAQILNSNVDLSTLFDERLVAYLNRKGRNKLADNISNLTFTLMSGNKPENTQAFSGGVALSEVDKATFASTKTSNLYVIGEALDIDGISGGYNLAFAFYSAVIAAKDVNDKFCQKNSSFSD